MRHAAVALPAVAALALFGCAARSASPQPPLSKSTARYVAYLENPARAAWQKPDEVVAALRLKGGEQVTDLGAGSGYFSRRLATAVGPSGRIDAADVDEGMLAYLRERTETEGIRNLVPRHVAADDPALPPASADLVFVCDTYHHLRDRVAYFQKVAGGLKADGRLVVVDFYKREDIAEGPPFAEKLARETVVDELRQAGFEVEREESFLPYQYFLVLRRAPRYSFEPFAERVSAVMSSKAEAGDQQWQVAALLSDYLQRGALEAKFQRPDPGLPVTTYLLHTDPAGRFSIAALVFQPRARTTIHDHQSWVVWGTYTGQERETRYRRRDVPGQSFPQLTPAWKRVFAGGEVSFIDPPPGDIHDVENVNDSVSVSLHVHATDIGEQARNSYDVRNNREIVRAKLRTGNVSRISAGAERTGMIGYRLPATARLHGVLSGSRKPVAYSDDPVDFVLHRPPRQDVPFGDERRLVQPGVTRITGLEARRGSEVVIAVVGATVGIG